MDTIDLSSFSHGQITSKLWLCEELEKHVLANANINILGGWYNVLGFMLSIRRPNFYATIHNTDIDPEAIAVADKLCLTWMIESTAIVNQVNDCCSDDYVMNLPADVVINCSVEHFDNNKWFDSLPKGTLVCIQSSDVIDPEYPWLIKQPSHDIETFLNRFPVSELLYSGTKRIQYYHFGYNRFMLIGKT